MGQPGGEEGFAWLPFPSVPVDGVLWMILVPQDYESLDGLADVIAADAVQVRVSHSIMI